MTDNTNITDEQIVALKRALKEAGPAPWHTGSQTEIDKKYGITTIYPHPLGGHGKHITGRDREGQGITVQDHNAPAIMLGRNLLPAILEERECDKQRLVTLEDENKRMAMLLTKHALTLDQEQPDE